MILFLASLFMDQSRQTSISIVWCNGFSFLCSKKRFFKTSWVSLEKKIWVAFCKRMEAKGGGAIGEMRTFVGERKLMPTIKEEVEMRQPSDACGHGSVCS
uniref:Uncharacterized protein n=1 Tax=Nelumbo nucifera TaxID=4432 RepID=A0A822YUT3_NELNU|nr:TPA_asm: hypothetical protein HUJ06_005495 [Nelumbo nucifera]